MGQEWAAATPFLFFTDHHPELGAKVTEGRRREFRRFAAFSDAQARERIPDPQAPSTFAASRLRWAELGDPAHGAMRRLYRRLLQLRARLVTGDGCTARALDAETILVTGDGYLVVARLGGAGEVRTGPVAHPHVMLSTEDAAFAVDPAPIVAHTAAGVVRFARPGAVVLAGAPFAP
jgi:maltooligosyltrehalose trehalohydrolase